MSEMIHFPWYGSRTRSDLRQRRFISSCQNPSTAAGFLSPLRYPVTEEHVAPTGEHDDPGFWIEITAVAWKSYWRVSQVGQAWCLCLSEMCHPPGRRHMLRFTSRMVFLFNRPSGHTSSAECQPASAAAPLNVKVSFHAPVSFPVCAGLLPLHKAWTHTHAISTC